MSGPAAPAIPEHRIFLLSPASLAGKRARLLLRDGAGSFETARALRDSAGAELGDVFTFASALYFRGKRAYARAFAVPPQRLAGAYVITTTRGLLPIETRVGLEALRELAGGTIDPREPAYRKPLLASAQQLLDAAPAACAAVLLGSIATDKYVAPLLAVWGRRLWFPRDFIGRGDMSRGGLMLRCAADGRELEYVTAADAERQGQRPPRLEPARRASPVVRSDIAGR